MPVIGILGSSTREGYAEQTDFLLAGLKDAGFVDGQNVRIEYRWADEQVDRLPTQAADLVRRQVSVIVTLGGAYPVRAAMAATTTISIVFVTGADPLRAGCCKPQSSRRQCHRSRCRLERVGTKET